MKTSGTPSSAGMFSISSILSVRDSTRSSGTSGGSLSPSDAPRLPDHGHNGREVRFREHVVAVPECLRVVIDHKDASLLTPNLH